MSRHLLPHVHKRHAWPTARCIRPCGGPICKRCCAYQKLLQCYKSYVLRVLDMSGLHTGHCLHEASPFLAPCCLHKPVMQRVSKKLASQVCVEPCKLALDLSPRSALTDQSVFNTGKAALSTTEAISVMASLAASKACRAMGRLCPLDCSQVNTSQGHACQSHVHHSFPTQGQGSEKQEQRQEQGRQ